MIITNVVIVENHIKEFRKQLKLSQEDLANKVGTSRQTISSIENYRHIPNSITAFLIASALGLKIEDVFEFRFIDKVD